MRPTARTILWWELRRVPYNLALLAIGLASLAFFYTVVGPMTPPGEDPVEPLVLIFGVIGYGIGANVCYTLGWITELTWDGADASVRKLQRQKLFFAGFVLSCALTTLPAGLATFTWMTNILLPR